MKRTTLMVMLMATSLLISTQAFAFPNRVDQVPNNMWGCALCHISAAGSGPRTPFGEDVKDEGTSGGNVDWSAICDLDSDDDGFSNGVELADPECMWAIGDENPSGMTTNPADADDAPEEDVEPEGGMDAPEGGMDAPEGGMDASEGGMDAPEGGMDTPEGGMDAPDDGSMETMSDSSGSDDGGCAIGGGHPHLFLSFLLLGGLFIQRKRTRLE